MPNASIRDRINAMWNLSDDEVSELSDRDFAFYQNHVVPAQCDISALSDTLAKEDAAYAAYLNNSRAALPRDFVRWARKP